MSLAQSVKQNMFCYSYKYFYKAYLIFLRTNQEEYGLAVKEKFHWLKNYKFLIFKTNLTYQKP